MSDRLTDLVQIEASVWRELSRAASERGHERRTPVLATAALDSQGAVQADARTVVLREVDTENRQLSIYTDSRAQKVGQLQQQPDAVLVFWSKQLGWQIRCRLSCEIEEEGLAVSSRWAQIKLTAAAQDYLAPLAPGQAIGTEAPVLARREHFALLSARVMGIDWLELHADGHRRAQFEGDQGRWVQP